jgi:hypothetical protein
MATNNSVDGLGLSEELTQRLFEAAKSGAQNGFVIKMRRPTGRKIVDPLSPTGEEEEEFVYDRKITKHKQAISTSDYKRYLEARDKLAKETDEGKRNDIMLRIYEFLALKYLGMTHQEFVEADFDDVAVAGLACSIMSEFGISSAAAANTQQQQRYRTAEAVIEETTLQNPLPSKHKRSNHYKAPDEE